MSEIAGDCNMSTGNVYRYFPSKLDIAEAFVRRIRTDQVARLKAAIADTDLSPKEKVRRFFQTKLRLTYDRFHNRPKAFELSAEILKERPDFANEWEKAEAGVLSGILEEGERDGVIAICNRARTARILQDAAFRFTSSSIFFEGEYDELASELDDVLDLILDGFAFRALNASSRT
jgi:AcrR family transcriptional regulator